jgi:hypothetical protein
VVEGAALEKRYAGNGIVGSNPTLSASIYPLPLIAVLDTKHLAPCYVQSQGDLACVKVHVRKTSHIDNTCYIRI